MTLTTHEDMMTSLFRELISCVDPNPERPGVQDTPRRMAQAWLEATSGYNVEPASLLKTFEPEGVGYDELVVVSNIPIYSTCEHHGAPIVGMATIGYLPGDKIVGLSKLARVADAFARRLQVQERLTVEIARCIADTIFPRATGVVIRAAHMCMSARGARVHGAVTTTSCMLGMLRTEPALRAEFFAMEKSA